MIDIDLCLYQSLSEHRLFWEDGYFCQVFSLFCLYQLQTLENGEPLKTMKDTSRDLAGFTDFTANKISAGLKIDPKKYDEPPADPLSL